MTRSKKKTNKKKSRIKKIIPFLLIVFLIILIIITINNNKKVTQKKNKDNSVEVIKELPLDEITLSQLNEKMTSEDKFIIYIGYEGCSACENYAPIIRRNQALLNYKAYYLNIKTLNKDSKEWKKFLNKVTIKQELNVSVDGELTKINDTVGNILKKYGYTPTTIYISNGKILNAHIGTMTSSEIAEFIK